MEHYLIHLFIRLVRTLNLRTQKPLSKVLPDFEMLHYDPEQILRQQPIYIGPWRKWGNVLVATLFASQIVWAFSCAGLLGFLGQGPLVLQRAMMIVLFTACFGGPVIIALVCRRFIYARAGEVLLHADGVVLRSRGENAFCPWQVFDTPGTPVRAGRDRVIVPVAGETIDLVVVEKNGVVQEGGPVRTRPLVHESGNEIILRGLYEVDILELASFFLFLGRKLNGDAFHGSGRSPVASPRGLATHSDTARLEKNGWVRVRLTRIRFPQRCCACGEPTLDAQEIQAQPFVSSGPEDVITLHIPACAKCQKLAKRRARRMLLLVCAAAPFALVGLCLLITALTLNLPGKAPLLGVIPAIIVLVVLGAWVWSSSRRRHALVEVRRYSQREGTLSLRFRWRGYGELLLAANDIDESTLPL